MDDLISRQAAIEELKDYIVDPTKAISEYEDNVFNYNAGLKTAIQAIADLPSTQPKRKKGKWIMMADAGDVYWVCSECGEDIPRVSHYNPEYDLFPRLESIEKIYFCPNCGADMREEIGDGEIH